MSKYFGSIITHVIQMCLLTGVLSTDPVLSPSPYVHVEENQSMTLTCTYPGTEKVGYCIWKEGIRTIGIMDRYCQTPKYIDKSLYEYTCPSKKVFQWTVKRIPREENGTRWNCQISINSVYIPSKQTTVVVHLAVPITSVSMTTPTVTTVNIIENTTSLQFICVTSAGRPQATVGWYIKPVMLTSTAEKVTGGSIQTSADADNLTIVTGNLSYSPTREDQGWQIYCTASNVQNIIKVSTRKPILNVLFSPTAPTLTYDSLDGPSIHSSSVNAIRGDDVKIGCSSKSNPEPAYRWSSQAGTSQILTIHNIQVDTTRTCTATNTMVPTVGTGPGQTSATSMVSINVMYGPSVPSLFYNDSSTIPATVNAIEGSTFPTITCSGSSSNPSPSSYSWSGSVTSANGSLSFVNVGKHQAGIFTCHVQNTMVRSHGDSAPVVGRNNKTFTLNVLYSPRLSHTIMTNITTAQHETASLNVTVIANPEPSSYVWAKFTGSTWTDLTSSSDVQISSRGLQSNLTVLDVKQSDYGQYRLTVTNTVDVFHQVFYVTQPKTGKLSDIEESKNVIVYVVFGGVGVLVVVVVPVSVVYRNKKQKIKEQHNSNPDDTCISFMDIAEGTTHSKGAPTPSVLSEAKQSTYI